MVHGLGSDLAKPVDERLNEALVGGFLRQGGIVIPRAVSCHCSEREVSTTFRG